MPVYHVTSPDGQTIEVTAPEGASEQDAIAYAQQHVQADPVLAARRQDAAAASAAQAAGPQAPPEPQQPTGLNGAFDAMATPADAAASVASSAIATPVSGIAGLGAMGEKGVLDMLGLHDAANKIDPAAIVQKYQEALTYQPRTYGGSKITGAVGAVSGLVPKLADYAGGKVLDYTGDPLLATEVNTGIQAIAMGVGSEFAPHILPAIGKTAKAVGNLPVVKPTAQLISDYMPGGAERAATRVVQSHAGSPEAAQSAAAQMDIHRAGASGALADKYGMQPTAAGVSGNAGLAQLERTLRSQSDTAPGFNARDVENRSKINEILTGISGTPEERLRATTARDFAARTAYEDALNNPEHFVQPPGPGTPSFDAELAANSGIAPPGGTATQPSATVQGLNPVGQRLQDLLQRPAMQTAMKNARVQAGNRGVALNDRNLIQQLHYAKLDLDAQIAAAPGDGGLLDTKHTLLGVMDDLSPAYKEARQSFQVQSGPINRHDIGQALKNRYMSALSEQSQIGSTPTSFMNALRNDEGDAIARTATGFGGAHMNQILTPQDMQALEAIRGQLGTEHFASNAGRGVGSPTAQNLANERSIANIGSLRGVNEDMGGAGNVAAMLTHPGLAIPAAMRGASVRAAARQRLANVMLDPEAAAAMLRKQSTPMGPTPGTGPAAVVSTAVGNDQAQQ